MNKVPQDSTYHSRHKAKSKMAKKPPPLISSLLMLFWIETIIATYFWAHKPWPEGQNIAPLMAVVDLLLAIVLVTLAGGMGRLIFGERLPFSPIENIMLQVALGIGILSLVVFFAGIFGFLGVRQAWYGLGIGVLLFWKPIFAWLRDWRIAFHRTQQSSIVEKASQWLVVFLIVITGLQALAPPLKWDSLVYHLELPQRYIQIGKIVHLSDNLFTGFSQLAEMMFTWAIALRSGTTAATLGWVVGVIAILGLGGFAERLCRKKIRWFAAAIMLSGASISRGLSWAYVDLWAFFFALATIIVLDQYVQSKNRVWVGLSAIFAGFAFNAKYTAGMIIPISVVYLFIGWVQSHQTSSFEKSQSDVEMNDPPSSKIQKRLGSSRPLVIPVLLFISISLIVAAPWLVKNFALTGNPIYPFIFDARDMDELRLSFYQGEGYNPTIFDHLALPITGTIFGIEGGPKFNTSISPLFLALIPAVVLGWRYFQEESRKRIIGLGSIIISAWFVWALGSQISSPFIRTRHYYVIFPALVILAIFGFDYLQQLKIGSLQMGWLVQNLVIFVFILTAVTEALFFAKASPIRVLSGFQTQSEYLAEQLGWFGPAMESVNSLPEGSNVAMFWEPRSFYCMVSCSPDVILDRWWYMMRTVGSAQEVTSILRSEGYTHVLLYDLGVRLVRDTDNLFEPGDWEELERFKNDELQIVKQLADTYTLYAIPLSTQE